MERSSQVRPPLLAYIRIPAYYVAVITQCCMRHLYNAQPKNEVVIQHAKNFERRRCNHHTLEKPLSARECLASVIDPKGNQTNKHRYVVACQDFEVQQYLQSIPGVPMIYIVRSVMIMKPMSAATAQVTAREEQSKLRSGIRKANQISQPATKRPAPDQASDQEESANNDLDGIGEVTATTTADGEPDSVGMTATDPTDAPPTKKRRKGPKGPNPLSVKKSKLTAAEPVPQSKSGNRRKR